MSGSKKRLPLHWGITCHKPIKILPTDSLVVTNRIVRDVSKIDSGKTNLFGDFEQFMKGAISCATSALREWTSKRTERSL